MKKLTFVLLCIAFIFLYNKYYLNKPVDMKKRYKCQYAVVTGATGGIGSEMVKKLSEAEFTVIAIGRSQTELYKLKQKYQRVTTFEYDFSKELTKFGQKFDDFLIQQSIQKEDIGICFSNAGYGDYEAFDKSDFKYKQQFLNVNIHSHICVCNYFVKAFLNRQSKSALEITSSVASYLCMPQMAMYHQVKTALSSLGSSLAIDYKNKIDVVVMHPTVVSNTKFYSHKGIEAVHDMDKMKFSVTPQQIVDKILTRFGKTCCIEGGSSAIAGYFASKVGRNVMGFATAFIKPIHGK